MGRKCAIKHCTSRINKAGCRHLRFFRFPHPSQLKRMMKWKLACDDNDVMMMDPVELHSSWRICSLHFEQYHMKRHHLNEEAVPTLKLKVQSSNRKHEEHLYFMAVDDLDVGHCVEISNRKEENTIKSIGCQTEEFKLDVETQTCFMGI